MRCTTLVSVSDALPLGDTSPLSWSGIHGEALPWLVIVTSGFQQDRRRFATCKVVEVESRSLQQCLNRAEPDNGAHAETGQNLASWHRSGDDSTGASFAHSAKSDARADICVGPPALASSLINVCVCCLVARVAIAVW